eukprot:jgi/Botrbrau1/18055/Bobra.0062s0043.1
MALAAHVSAGSRMGGAGHRMGCPRLHLGSRLTLSWRYLGSWSLFAAARSTRTESASWSSQRHSDIAVVISFQNDWRCERFQCFQCFSSGHAYVRGVVCLPSSASLDVAAEELIAGSVRWENLFEVLWADAHAHSLINEPMTECILNIYDDRVVDCGPLCFMPGDGMAHGQGESGLSVDRASQQNRSRYRAMDSDWSLCAIESDGYALWLSVCIEGDMQYCANAAIHEPSCDRGVFRSMTWVPHAKLDRVSK